MLQCQIPPILEIIQTCEPMGHDVVLQIDLEHQPHQKHVQSGVQADKECMDALDEIEIPIVGSGHLERHVHDVGEAICLARSKRSQHHGQEDSLATRELD